MAWSKSEPTFCPLEVCFIDDGACFEAIESSFSQRVADQRTILFRGFFRILISEFIDSYRRLESRFVREIFVPLLGVHLGLGTKRAPPRVVVGFWFAARRSFVDRIGQRRGDKRSPFCLYKSTLLFTFFLLPSFVSYRLRR